MASTNFVMPFRPAFDSSGVPIAGAKAYFYYTGTTTLAPIYIDAAMTAPASNPVVANGVGRFPQRFINDAITYRLRVTTPAGVQLEQYDPYTGQETGSTGATGASGASVLWPYVGHVGAAYDTTAHMALVTGTTGDKAVVYDDAGTWPGAGDSWPFPAEGRYVYQSSYWNWYRTLEQASTDENFNAVFTQNENHARGNLGITGETIGKEVVGTINSLGSGQPTWWQRWDVTNVDGSGIWQVRQNGSPYFELSGFYPEIVIFPSSGRAFRLRAVSTGYGAYSGTDTSSGEPAQLYNVGWNDPAHMGPDDSTSVIEVFWQNGTGGRVHQFYPGALGTSAKRFEFEGSPGYSGVIPFIFYESASSLGRTLSIENSGQASEFAGDSVSRPVTAFRNFQTTNGLWLTTWGTNTTPNAWAKSDGLFRVTSLELPEGTPANPAADSLRLYAKDVAGVTKLAYRNSAGTETVL